MQLMYGTYSLWEHISRIVIGFGKSSKREWLTWGASGNNINIANGLKVKLSNISLVNKARSEVLAKTFARPLVELHKSAMLEPGQFKALGQSAAATE